MRTKPAATLLVLAALAACSGGGGGPSDVTPPTLIAAAWLGPGAAPAAGDTLMLSFSEDVKLVAGAALDDADVVLSGGGTLGAVAAAPVSMSARTVLVTLGAGVTFTAGTTTLAFSAAQDAVQDSSGNLATVGTAATITDGDGDNPVITLLTANAVDGELNGSGPAGGTLQAPRNGFTIDLTFTDATSTIDTTKTSISADGTVTIPGGSLQPGTNLADPTTTPLTASHSGGSSSYFVPSGVLFPDGAVTLTAYVTDTTGRTSAAATFTFRTRSINDDIRPLEATQLWFIDTSRDIESFTAVADFSGTRVADITIGAGANGRPDLEDIWRILGLHSAMPISNVSGGMDSNEVVSQLFETQMLQELDQLFDGADVDFTFDPPGTFPAGESSVAYASFGFSQLCVAGAAANAPSSTLGAAILDLNNSAQNDDCLTDFQNVRLGVFAHTLARVGYISGGPTTMFRQTYEPLTPSISGTPIGGDPGDAATLQTLLADGTPSGSRPTLVANAISRFTRSIAVVVAHECGHSMGLVKNGPMPAGLFGGDPDNFPLSPGLGQASADSHIQNISLFPSGAQNVMSPAIDFESALSSETAFNSLNLAYLRERVLYDNQ